MSEKHFPTAWPFYNNILNWYNYKIAIVLSVMLFPCFILDYGSPFTYYVASQ